MRFHRDLYSAERHDSEIRFLERSAHVSPRVSQFRGSRIAGHESQRDGGLERRSALVRNQKSGDYSDNFPTGHVRSGFELSLDGKHRDGSKRQHGARFQRFEQLAQSANPLHGTIGQQSIRRDGPGRGDHYQWRGLANWIESFALGRLQFDDCRSVRRLHLLVYD